MKKDKKSSITTKKGDQGTTGLRDRSRVPKYDLRPETTGTLDEAAAFIGWARAKTQLEKVKKILWMIQNHIFLINAEIACPPESLHLIKSQLLPEHLTQLETKANEIESVLDLPKKFVLYGQSETSALIDVARAVVRRAERRFSELSRNVKIKNQIIPAYLNRVSDVLYLLARYEEKANNIPFAHPDRYE